jgi:hypothetical protein
MITLTCFIHNNSYFCSMSDAKKLRIVDLDAETTIPVTGLFLTDLQECLYHLFELYNKANPNEGKHFFEMLSELTQRDPENKFEAHVKTMLALIYTIETAFKEAGQAKGYTQEELEKMIKDQQDSTDSQESSPES